MNGLHGKTLARPNRRNPQGTIHVVDPSPLNWLFVLFNTMEELVRADHNGIIIPALAKNYQWLNDRTLEVELRQDVIFQDGEPFSVHTVKQNFHELHRWEAPHPPGTWLNLPTGTVLEEIDEYTFRLQFPHPEGLALGKMRVLHMANRLFWQRLGFGYAKRGSGEGRW